MRYVKTAIIVAVLVGLACGSSVASARGLRGLGYDEALQSRQAPTGVESTRPDGPSAAEKRAISVWGWRVGRWFDDCRRYWPSSQMRNVLYCIKHESGGNPNARNGIYIGLFQLGGYSCNVWPPSTNIRLAHKLWLSRGWQPWSTMR